MVTAAILAGSWRPAYLLLVALDLTAAALWALHHRRIPATRRGSRRPPETAASPSPAMTEPAATWSRQRVVSVLTLGLIVFFVYTGLEVSAGQWETSYLRGHLDLSASSAGLAAFGYWGALTAVRIGLALPARPVPAPARDRLGHGCQRRRRPRSSGGSPSTAVVVAGFVILGAALAGVFPALIATTPQRIGDQRAQHAIAWQVGAAAAGGSAISALIGLLIDTTSLAIVGPAILTLALLLVLANSALARLAPIPVPDGPRH